MTYLINWTNGARCQYKFISGTVNHILAASLLEVLSINKMKK